VKYFLKFFSFFALVIVLSSSGLRADDLIHVVGRGETIYSISRRYQVNANDLMRANNITDPSTLQAGRRLIIPSQASQAVPAAATQPAAPAASTQALVDYRVVRGDTLYSIARNNGITLQNLLEINSFSSNHVIRVGDVIKVPGRGGAGVAQNTTPVVNTSPVINSTASDGFPSLRWPVTPKDIAYMTGRTGVVVEGEHLESVRSLTVGNVISAGPWRKFGRVVIVEAAGGYFYMYGGCESLSVNVGDRITPGMEVGKLGVNSVTEKPQLFFMVFRNDTPIDPALAPRAAGNAKT
jgi:LysM repeat protein